MKEHGFVIIIITMHHIYIYIYAYMLYGHIKPNLRCNLKKMLFRQEERSTL